MKVDVIVGKRKFHTPRSKERESEKPRIGRWWEKWAVPVPNDLHRNLIVIPLSSFFTCATVKSLTLTLNFDFSVFFRFLLRAARVGKNGGKKCCGFIVLLSTLF